MAKSHAKSKRIKLIRTWYSFLSNENTLNKYLIKMNTSSEKEMLNVLAQAIYDKKGFNIMAIDVQECSSLIDYFLIAEGSVDRHVQALSRTIGDALHQHGRSPLRVEGAGEGDWIVIDCEGILIHLFTPELREKYALEALWHEGKIVDLDLNKSV